MHFRPERFLAVFLFRVFNPNTCACLSSFLFLGSISFFRFSSDVLYSIVRVQQSRKGREFSERNRHTHTQTERERERGVCVCVCEKIRCAFSSLLFLLLRGGVLCSKDRHHHQNHHLHRPEEETNEARRSKSEEARERPHRLFPLRTTREENRTNLNRISSWGGRSKRSTCLILKWRTN